MTDAAEGVACGLVHNEVLFLWHGMGDDSVAVEGLLQMVLGHDTLADVKGRERTCRAVLVLVDGSLACQDVSVVIPDRRGRDS
jgi:predicted esterase